MPSIAAAFSEPPKKWGYSGDPFLWDALGWTVSNEADTLNKAAQTPVDTKCLLEKAFNSLVACNPNRDGVVALEWLPGRGKSDGLIHRPTWEAMLIPEILRRLSSSHAQSSVQVEYHPAEHRFRFAAWAASTAASRSRSVCSFRVSVGVRLLQQSDIRWLALGSHWLPPTRDAFDAEHERWCQFIKKRAKKSEKTNICGEFSYGIAAKLVNCFLKALFLQTMAGPPFEMHEFRNGKSGTTPAMFLHPPIDRLLLTEATRRSDPEKKHRWKELLDIGWSKFSQEDYHKAIQLVRETVGENLSQIEAYWPGHQ